LAIVLQDAFSSKYKSAMHSGVFESAVKKYRREAKASSKKKPGEEDSEELSIPTRVHPSAVEELSTRAQKSLENLPGQVLEQARVFHRHVQHLVQAEPEGVVGPDVKLMLDDIGRAQKLDERIKDEILQDEDARNVSTGLYFTFYSASITKSAPRRCPCLVLKVSPSLECCILIPEPLPEALRELIDIAENTLSTLAERDLLVTRYREQQEVNESRNPGDEASGSGTYHHDTLHDSDVS
jgi:hypothetical protein